MAEQYDLNCKTCIRLYKKKFRRKTCSERGVTEFNKACDDWEPDMENISAPLEEIRDLMVELSYAELQTCYWLTEEIEKALKSGIDFKIGQWVYYDYKGKLFKFQVQNIGEDFVFGVTKDGRKFRVMPERVSRKPEKKNEK